MNKDLIMDLISDNKTQEALRILKERLASHDLKIEVILLSRRLESLNQKVRLGIIEEHERNKEENQINYSIISLVSKVEFVDYDFSKDSEPKVLEIELSNENIKSNNSDITDQILNKTKKRINIPYGTILVLTGLAFGIYHFFFKPKPPVDCNTSLTFRNSVPYVETNTESFNNLYYKDITVFAITFEKSKLDTSNNIWVDAYVEFEKTPKDSMDVLSENYKYMPPNLHFNFKNGGEAYVLTTFDRFYSLRNVHHIHFKSDTLSIEIIEKIKNNEISGVSLFNEAFSLSPHPNVTLPFEDDPNHVALMKLTQNMRCLLKYRSPNK